MWVLDSRPVKTKRLAVDTASLFFAQLWNLEILPVSAAVAATSTVEPAAATAMEPAAFTAVKSATAVETSGAAAEPATTVEAMIAAPEAAVIEATSAEAASPAIEITPTAEAAPVKTASIKAATVETVEPRACADKEAVYKVLWTVETVRRAIIWVIAIIAVGAHRSRTVVARANSNHNLRMRRSRRRKRADGQ